MVLDRSLAVNGCGLLLRAGANKAAMGRFRSSEARLILVNINFGFISSNKPCRALRWKLRYLISRMV